MEGHILWRKTLKGEKFCNFVCLGTLNKSFLYKMFGAGLAMYLACILRTFSSPVISCFILRTPVVFLLCTVKCFTQNHEF